MAEPISKNARIFVTGHRGLVGSALLRLLNEQAFTHVLTAGREQLDLLDQRAVLEWFRQHRPEYVIHAAGKVGGIRANSTQPANFLYENTLIHATVLHAAREAEVKKLLYLGSSCIYPRDCPQPIKEEYLLTGPLEQTNYAYAIAKISGLLACRAYHEQYGCRFISAMPTNLYGPGDNFHPTQSHVLPGLMRRFHEARHSGEQEVIIWGSGRALREFLHVDDLASACLFLLENYEQPDPINIGSGQEVSIGELAQLLQSIIYPQCRVVFDTNQPDGTPRKRLDVSKLNQLGWSAKISLETGIRATYDWYQNSHWNKESVNPSASSC